jgi:hypothetical protein
MERLLKPDEAGAILGVSPRTLAGWRVSGTGPPWFRVGGVRYCPRRLAEWVESQERAGRKSSKAEEQESAQSAIRGRQPRPQKGHRLGGYVTRADHRAAAEAEAKGKA